MVITSGTVATDGLRTGWQVAAEQGARRLAAITFFGAAAGVLVGGVGGRLAMMLLARLSPSATGATSDDGFTIGQFTVANTLNLIFFTLLLGVAGGGIYALLRGLMIGPRWFQVLSMAAGAAAVVGAAIVHTDGVDFQLLKPTWLAIALFVAIPGAYAALLTLLAEPALRPDSWWSRAPRLRALAPLLLWIPAFFAVPVLVVVVAGWVAREWLRRTPYGVRLLGNPILPWVARAGLAALFAFAVADLASDTSELT